MIRVCNNVKYFEKQAVMWEYLVYKRSVLYIRYILGYAFFFKFILSIEGVSILYKGTCTVTGIVM